jgi:hypothetical protein
MDACTSATWCCMRAKKTAIISIRARTSTRSWTSASYPFLGLCSVRVCNNIHSPSNSAQAVCKKEQTHARAAIIFVGAGVFPSLAAHQSKSPRSQPGTSPDVVFAPYDVAYA